MIPVSYNLRSIAVRKTTSIATAGGIALVVFVFSAVSMSGGPFETLVSSGARDVAIVPKGLGRELAS